MSDTVTDLYAEVRPKPGSLLDRCLAALANPRKHRWNAYLRACRAIPKDSPVAGSTSWKKINARRGELIDQHHAEYVFPIDGSESPELQALQAVAGAMVCRYHAASAFLMARVSRRLQAKLAAAIAVENLPNHLRKAL